MAAICVFCASSNNVDQRWLELARTVGVGLAERGHVLVSGGGRVGMMGTVAAGARSAGGHTVGVIPEALVSQEVADTEADDLIVTADMATRKTQMLAKSDGFLVLPGGIGTLDELFEVWTIGSLALHDKPVVVLNSEGFYSGLLEWMRGLVPAGFLRRAALDQLVVVDSVPAALDAVTG